VALSVKEIENARPGSKDRKLHDEKGLYLLVAPSGSKRWHFKYRYLGVEKKMSLGAYPEVTLKLAREKRDAARAMLAEGKDPQREKQASKLAAKVQAANTFSAIAREYLDKCRADGLAEVTVEKSEWLLSLLEPSLGRRPISEITTPELFSVLQDIHGSGRRETARRLRSFAGRVFQRAILTGRAQSNPAHALQRTLASPKVRSHPAIVERVAFGGLLKAIESYQGYPSTGGALRLSPHVFQRPGEIRTMKWADIDFGNARWNIPATIMKMRRTHEVPLSRQAIEIIRSMAEISNGSEFVFPSFSSPKKPISENTVNQALRRLGYGGVMTAHGFRSTASSLLNESRRWSPDAIERALAHEDENAIRAIYNRASYWDERVAMMQWWSDQIDALKTAER
jgi:integrase